MRRRLAAGGAAAGAGGVAAAVALVVAAAAAAGGCATSLSTMQPYEALRPGGVHFSTGYSVNVPVSQSIRLIRDTADFLIGLGNEPDLSTVTTEEWATLASSIMAVSLITPGFENEYMARLGVIDDLDVGFRWAWSTARLDAKFQFYRYKPSRRFDMGVSIDVGVGYHFFNGWIFDVLEYLDIEKFRRYDGEASLIAGMTWGTYDYLMLWFGPKIMLSHYVIDGNLSGLCEPTKMICTPDDYRLVDEGDTAGGMGLYGGFVGVAAGYRWIWFTVELTVMWSVAKHHLLPGLLAEDTNLGGLLVFPSWGFFGRFNL